MVTSASKDHEPAAVAVLFSPETVPILDIFRALGDFEDHYDMAALDALEGRLTAAMTRDLAKGLVSDALLLAFGLRRDRSAPLEFRPILSRRGSLDEYRLMGIIGAAFSHDLALAGEAAGALGIRHPQPLISLAFDIARRLEAAGIELQAPDPRLLHPQPALSLVEMLRERRHAGEFKFSFDL